MPISKIASGQSRSMVAAHGRCRSAIWQELVGASLPICSWFSILAKFTIVAHQNSPTTVSPPQYELFCGSGERSEPGRWRFILRAVNGSTRLAADDVEPGIHGERLALLTVVRGLEALGQPSRVTVITPSRYVREGIRYGLPEWRRNQWRWECFGAMVPVRDCDLWRRVDRAMRFHELQCRTWRFDPPHVASPVSAGATCRPREATADSRASGDRLECGEPGRYFRLVSSGVRKGQRRLAQAWETLVPSPWFG